MVKSNKELKLAIKNMPNLISLYKPLIGLNILGCSHLTRETGVLIKTLYKLGANINWCAGNIHSSNDKIVEEIKRHKWCEKIKGKKKMNVNEFWDNILEVLNFKNGYGPDIVIDSGVILTPLFHLNITQDYMGDNHYNKLVEIRKSKPDRYWNNLKNNIKLFIQKTTSGTFYLKYLEENNYLFCPVIDINSSITKSKIDNIYGSCDSCIRALRNSGINLTKINALVVGYGNVGKGVAKGLKDNNANVTVTEINPICALQATMEGFQVDKIKNVIYNQDLIITCTGKKNVIDTELILMMKNGAKLANMGNSSIEIDVKGLNKISLDEENIKEFITEYTLPNKNKINLLSDGELINTSLANGHPSHIMSLTFSNIIYAILDFQQNKKYSENKIYYLDKKIQEEIAFRYLKYNNIQID